MLVEMNSYELGSCLPESLDHSAAFQLLALERSSTLARQNAQKWQRTKVCMGAYRTKQRHVVSGGTYLFGTYCKAVLCDMTSQVSRLPTIFDT